MTTPSRSSLSRREFVLRCGGFFASPLCAPSAISQVGPSDSVPPPRSLEATLLRQFKGAQLRAISPDGSLICLYTFRHLQTFLRPWSYDGGKTTAADDTLSVVNLKTGDHIYATRLRTMVVNASFFADGKHLYAETLPMAEVEGGRATTVQQAAIDLDTRRLDERLHRLADANVQYFALAWPAVLGVKALKSQINSLVRAVLPDYKETAQAPFASERSRTPEGPAVLTGGGVTYGRDTTPAISSDTETMVYGAGHSIVCRRTGDLSVVWVRSMEPEYSGAFTLDITPNGSRVAAAIVGGSYVADQRSYVGVYDGRNGSVVARLNLDGHDGVAISPDGELLAVSQPVGQPDGRVVPTINLYEIGSGRQVGKVAHEPVSVSGFRSYGRASLGGRFTPDGRYLITSSGTEGTSVWAIRR